jgi:hypothetical protein
MLDWPNLFAAAIQRPMTLIERLSPLNQIRVIVGLFVVIVLGIVIFIVIKAGSHMVSGLSAAANRLPSSSVPKDDDWANKPLNQLPKDE